jgi:hypothetical protein
MCERGRERGEEGEEERAHDYVMMNFNIISKTFHI